jgi:hypothetical protein
LEAEGPIFVLPNHVSDQFLNFLIIRETFQQQMK